MKKLFNKFMQWFIPDSDDKGSENGTKDSTDSFEDFSDNIPLASANVLKMVRDASKRYWGMGKSDGVIHRDSTPSISSLAVKDAELLHAMAVEELEGRQASMKQEIRDTEGHISKLIREVKECTEYLHLMLTSSRYSSNSFAWGMAVVYLACGLIILFSDFVLALQLITTGFNEFVNMDYPISDLFYDPLGVFFANWQVILTSLGIATITVYIKVFYDDYLAVSDGTGQLRLRKVLREMGESQERPFWWLAVELALKTVLRLGILASVLYLLYVLAEFRFQALMILEDNVEVDNPMNQAAKKLFLWMTLVFPIVAGVCFSLAVKIILNRMKRTRAVEDLKLTEAMHRNEEQRQRELMGKLKEVEAAIGFWHKFDLALRLVSIYGLGRERADSIHDPVTPDDGGIVERVKRFRDRTVKKKQALYYNELKS